MLPQRSKTSTGVGTTAGSMTEAELTAMTTTEDGVQTQLAWSFPSAAPVEVVQLHNRCDARSPRPPPLWPSISSDPGKVRVRMIEPGIVDMLVNRVSRFEEETRRQLASIEQRLVLLQSQTDVNANNVQVRPVD